MEVQALSHETMHDAVGAPNSTASTTFSNPRLSAVPVPASVIDSYFSHTTNLSTSALGARVLSVSDDYFASASNLLTPTPAIRRPGVYVHTGAWYDGWESRRHNQKPFDWAVIALGCVGTIQGIEVDTAYFNGNEAPAAGLDACFLTSEELAGDCGVEKEGFTGWTEVLPPRTCGPSQRQAWDVQAAHGVENKFTHLRLKMYPDGGIARLRVYGSAIPPPLPARVSAAEQRPLEELSSALNGGVAIACSDQHFGVRSNLLLPGRGKDMGDGWETARSRTKGHTDWVIAKLGLPARSIDKVIVDTKDFRGNFPQAVKVEMYASVEENKDPAPDDTKWVPLVSGERPCVADTEHTFDGKDLASQAGHEDTIWTHVKVTIIPDGGVKRLRIFGRRA